jgi:DNA transformation protein
MAPRTPPSPAALPDFVVHCLELLAGAAGPAAPARPRRMFGGWGLYLGDLFVALIADERLFLKVAPSTRAAFEAAGCQPFVYEGKGKAMTLSYWTAPTDAMDSPALMLPWARLAVQAALATRSAQVSRAMTGRKPHKASATTAPLPAGQKRVSRAKARG